MPGERARGSVTAKLCGELDHFSADSVRAMLDELTQDKTVKYLILDMSGMTFMDSSGVGVIIGRYKRMAARGGGVKVCGASRQVDRLMELSGLYKIVQKCEQAGDIV